MSDILVRNLEPTTVEQLKARAKRNGRSLQAEVREILANEANRDEALDEFSRVASEIRERWGRVPQSDSAELIRDDRDR